MVSEGARPWGRGRSGDCELQENYRAALFRNNLSPHSPEKSLHLDARIIIRGVP